MHKSKVYPLIFKGKEARGFQNNREDREGEKRKIRKSEEGKGKVGYVDGISGLVPRHESDCV